MSIVVVGSINKDISINLERFPMVGETIFSTKMIESLGGKGLNQAIAASRQNATVDFIGAVGNDPFGNYVINRLKSESIDTQGIQLIDNQVTGTAVIMVDENADNSIILDNGANFDIDRKLIDEHINKIIEAEYCIMQCEIPFDTIKYVASICKDNNTKLVLNPAPFSNEIDEDLLSNTFCVIPNEIELNQLVGNNEEESLEALVKKLHSLGPDNVIVTLGDKGCYYSFEGGNDNGYIKANKVLAVDTTAAGDTFIGTFVSEYGNNKNLVPAIEYATKASAIAITKHGAVESIPKRDEILKELK